MADLMSRLRRLHPDFEVAVGPFPGPLTGAQFEKSETTLQHAVLDAWRLMWSTGV